MTISIYPVPFELNPSVEGDMPNINITADPIELDEPKIKFIFSQFPAAPRNPELDIVYDCKGLDRFGEPDKGVFDITEDLSISGIWLNKTIWADPLNLSIEIPDETEFILGGVWASSVIGNSNLDIDPELLADFLFEIPKTAFVKWAKVGTMDFERDQTNKAGELPMDWGGTVTNMCKLANTVMVYGLNGVSILSPSGIYWGLRTIHRVGLLGRDAFSGSDRVHFFIDQTYKLFKFDGQLEELDYSDELSSLTDDVVLSYDPRSDLLYMCDGVSGFVYSPKTRSLGEGPINLTGIDYQNQTEYAVSPAAITIPAFEIWTDTQDMGSRHGKNVESIEFGADITQTLEASIRFRNNKADAFIQTDWYTVDPRGQVFIPCYGYEFQVGLRSSVYSYFELDYIKVRGQNCAY